MGDAALAHVIPGAPSPTELIKAAVQLKKVYDAFCHKHKNAANQVRELASLVNTFSINLANQGWILGRAGRFFPNEDKFYDTIGECDDFLHDYESLLIENRPNRVRKVWDTTKWSFEDEQRTLIEKLNAHTQAMNSFSLNVLLGIALHDKEAIRSYSGISERVTVAKDDPTLQKFEKLYEHLFDQVVVFQNHQKRAGSSADADFQPQFDAILKKWRDILIESGLPEDQVPQLPDTTGREAIEATADQFRRAFVAEGRHTSHFLRPSERPVPPLGNLMEAQPNTLLPSAGGGGDDGSGGDFTTGSPFAQNYSIQDQRRNSSVSTDPSIISRTSSIAHSQAPSSVFSRTSPSQTPLSAVTVGMSKEERRKSSSASYLNSEGSRVAPNTGLVIGGREIRLSSYEVGVVGRKRMVVWNRGTPHQLEQTLPSGSAGFPFSKHSRVASRPNEVTFLEKHELKFDGGIFHECPRYFFSSSFDSIAFQSAVRRRQLKHTSDVETICTSMSSRHGEAADQHLKIWKSVNTECHYLCYYANNNNSRTTHREFPVRWFDRPAPAKRSSKAATSTRLTFVKPKRPREGDSSRKSRQGSVSSSAANSPEAGPASRRSSTASTFSTATSKSVDASLSSVPTEEASKLGYLDIHFGSAGDCDSFLNAFRAAYDESITPVLEPSPIIVSSSPPKEPDRQATAPPTQRATPMGLLGLNLSMEALRID